MKKGRSLNGPLNGLRVYKKMHRLNDKISVEKRKKEYNAGMKFIHLADLHIGKRVNEFSMIDDQKFIFQQILRIIEEEKPPRHSPGGQKTKYRNQRLLSSF